MVRWEKKRITAGAAVVLTIPSFDYYGRDLEDCFYTSVAYSEMVEIL